MNKVIFWYAQTLVANYSVLVDSITESIKAWPINTLSCRKIWTHKGCHSRDIMLLASDSLHSFLVSLKFTRVGNSCGQITIHRLPSPLFVKKNGGMRLRDLRSWNNSILAKKLWNIHKTKDNLWIKWINQVFLRGRSIYMGQRGM